MYKSTKNKHAKTIIRDEINHVRGALALAAKDVRKDVKRRSAHIQNRVAGTVGDKPFRALGIAVLSGMFLAMVMRRKQNSQRHD